MAITWTNGASYAVGGEALLGGPSGDPALHFVDLYVYARSLTGSPLTATGGGVQYRIDGGAWTPLDSANSSTIGTSATMMGSAAMTVSKSYSGPRSVAWSVYYERGSIYTGYSVSGTITIPQRPPELPSAPTSVTATRNSDTRIDLTWVRPANAGNAATIWSNVRVYRSVNGGAYVQVANALAGTTTSWSDTATSANNTYTYRVHGYNVSGQGPGTVSNAQDTTPAAPSNVVAQKVGTTVVLTWTDNSNADAGFEVYKNAVLQTTTAANATTWTDTSPGTGTLTYTVRAKTDGPVLYSTYGTSNPVSTEAKPNPPIIVSPNGQAVLATEPVILDWTHNPVDTTAQTAYEVDHRLVGAGTWTTESGTTAGTETLPVGTYPSGSEVEWRVRTKGAHVDWSNYSATATFSLVTKPVGSITYPVTGTDHEEPSVTIEWSYYQADSHPQSAWETEVRKGGVLLESGSGAGAAAAWTSSTILSGLETYEARLRVRESSGYWSDWDSVTFDVAFDPPLAPDATVEWVSAGYYEVTGTARSDGVAPETAYLQLERSVNGGPWQIIAGDLGTDFTYFDWTAPMVGYVVYRVTAITVLPSMASTEVVSDRLPEDACEILLSGGPGFAVVARLLYDQKRDITAGVTRVLNQWDGRENPTSTSGLATTLEFSVSAMIRPPVPSCDGVRPVLTPADLVALSQQRGIHLYRDHEGWAFPCHLSPVSIDPDHLGKVSFTVTKVDAPSADYLAALAGYEVPTLVETRPGEYMVAGGDFEETAPGEWGLAP